MSSPKFLKKCIEDIYNTSPLLIVGEARLLFLRAWQYKVNRVTNTKELREVTNYYSTIKDSKPIVIDDLSLLQESSLKLLLKLVEESKTPVILLSSYDNLDSILLSRIKTFIRFNEPIHSDFLDLQSFYDVLVEKDFKDSKASDKLKFYLEKCPMYLQLEYDLNTSSNKNKILSILAGGE
jgi:hypothetical protein